MDRLTKDIPVEGMSTFELMHNITYPQNGEIRYRDFENDMTLRGLVRIIASKFDIELPEDNEEFGCELMDWLQYGVYDGSMQGILSALYYALVGYDDLRSRLKHYEDQAEPMEIKEVHCDEYICPRCGTENNADEFKVTDNYCPKCGQSLILSRNEVK